MIEQCSEEEVRAFLSFFFGGCRRVADRRRPQSMACEAKKARKAGLEGCCEPKAEKAVAALLPPALV